MIIICCILPRSLCLFGDISALCCDYSIAISSQVLMQSLFHVFEIHQQYQQAVTENLHTFTHSIFPSLNDGSPPPELFPIKSSTTNSSTFNDSLASSTQPLDSPKRVKKQVASFFSKLIRPSQSATLSSQFYVNTDSETVPNSQADSVSKSPIVTSMSVLPSSVNQPKRESHGMSCNLIYSIYLFFQKNRMLIYGI